MILRKMPQSVPFLHPVVLFSRMVLLLAFIDLSGWAFHIAVLTSGIPGFSSMKPNTALALGLLAICCRARMRMVEGRYAPLRLIPRFAIVVAMLLSCGTLAEYACGRTLGLDGLIFGVPMDRFGDPPGRMAFGTALCITLTGVALGFLDRTPKFSLWALLGANVITVAALLGFIVNRGPLFNVFWLRSLSVPTTVCLLLFAVATLCLRPERRPTSLLLQSKADGGKTRRWSVVGGLVLALLMALPAVVTMNTGIPEGFSTFLILGVTLLSVQHWLAYVEIAHEDRQPSESLNSWRRPASQGPDAR